MSGRDFERFVADLLRSRGFIVEPTGGANDKGIDILAVKDGVRYAVQCKRYADAVSRHAVSDVVGAKALHRCEKAIVITNSTFTPGAMELARANDCLLVGREELHQWVQSGSSDLERWHDGSAPIRLDSGLELRLNAPTISQPLIDRSSRAYADQRLLLVPVQIRNLSDNLKRNYVPWRNFLRFGEDAYAVDNLGNRYEMGDLGLDQPLKAQEPGANLLLLPGHSVNDLLWFEEPVAAATWIQLCLPARNIGGTGVLRIRLQRPQIAQGHQPVPPPSTAGKPTVNEREWVLAGLNELVGQVLPTLHDAQLREEYNGAELVAIERIGIEQFVRLSFMHDFLHLCVIACNADYVERLKRRGIEATGPRLRDHRWCEAALSTAAEFIDEGRKLYEQSLGWRDSRSTPDSGIPAWVEFCTRIATENGPFGLPDLADLICHGSSLCIIADGDEGLDSGRTYVSMIKAIFDHFCPVGARDNTSARSTYDGIASLEEQLTQRVAERWKRPRLRPISIDYMRQFERPATDRRTPQEHWAAGTAITDGSWESDIYKLWLAACDSVGVSPAAAPEQVAVDGFSVSTKSELEDSAWTWCLRRDLNQIREIATTRLAKGDPWTLGNFENQTDVSVPPGVRETARRLVAHREHAETLPWIWLCAWLHELSKSLPSSWHGEPAVLVTRAKAAALAGAADLKGSFGYSGNVKETLADDPFDYFNHTPKSAEELLRIGAMVIRQVIENTVLVQARATHVRNA
jgi:hypothetical protein